MKKIIFILSLLFFVKSFSQTHRFIYELQIKSSSQIPKTNMVLDIDKEYVKFYDYDFIKNEK